MGKPYSQVELSFPEGNMVKNALGIKLKRYHWIQRKRVDYTSIRKCFLHTTSLFIFGLHFLKFCTIFVPYGFDRGAKQWKAGFNFFKRPVQVLVPKKLHCVHIKLRKSDISRQSISPILDYGLQNIFALHCSAIWFPHSTSRIKCFLEGNMVKTL